MSICYKLFSFSIHVMGGESCLGRNQTMKQLIHILHYTMLCKIHVMRNWLEKNSALFNIIGLTFYEREYVASYKPFVMQQLQKMPLGGKQKLQHDQWSKTTYISEIDMEIPILSMNEGRISLSLLLCNPLLTVSSTSPHHALLQCCQLHRWRNNSALQSSRAICEHNLATQLTKAVESFSYRRWVGETFPNLHK